MAFLPRAKAHHHGARLPLLRRIGDEQDAVAALDHGRFVCWFRGALAAIIMLVVVAIVVVVVQRELLAQRRDDDAVSSWRHAQAWPSSVAIIKDTILIVCQGRLLLPSMTLGEAEDIDFPASRLFFAHRRHVTAAVFVAMNAVVHVVHVFVVKNRHGRHGATTAFHCCVLCVVCCVWAILRMSGRSTNGKESQKGSLICSYVWIAASCESKD